jgi:hypothetical protein
MCVICSTIPAVMAVGVSAQAKQNRKKKDAALRGEFSSTPAVPAGKATVAVLVFLVLASATIHSQL